MALVQDLLDRLQRLASEREPWERHWYDVARYALPDAERFDGMFATRDKSQAIDAVVSEPIAAKRSRDIYDMTSLWAIDRGAAGTLSLVTPQTGTWHDLESDDPFGPDPSDEEERFYERLRDYLFATRGNPRSGFWTAHKAAMRSMWAFGTSVIFIEESNRGISSPISYRFVPLSENHLSADFEGNVDTDFRVLSRTARSCVEKWGSKVSAKVQKMAESDKDKDKPVRILHAVYPRNERGSYGNTNRDSRFASCYVEVEEKHLIGESGYFEFPYRVDHWQRNNPGPYAEGPIALALSDIKSLNLLAKNALRASQQAVDPPIATLNDDLPRLNLNSRAVNPGYINAQGQLLAQPIVTAQRPDFAQVVIEAKQNQIRETLYVNLWQILISNPNMTATEAMIRANEKGDLLGPVGSSIQVGLSHQVDREVAILARRDAFVPGSPLEAPESLGGRSIGVRFTSPLDKLRRLPQMQGMAQLVEFATNVAKVQVESGEPPTVLDKFDFDKMLDEARDILNAPLGVMATEDMVEAKRTQRQQMMAAQQGIQGAQGAGEAAQSAAAGMDALTNSPAAAAILQRLAGVNRAA